MSGAPRVRSTNVGDSEARPVLVPAGNKAQRLVSVRKSSTKPLRKVDKLLEEVEAVAEERNGHPSLPTMAPQTPSLNSVGVPSILRRHEQFLHSNLSLNASCSSDASSDSFHSRASTGRLYRTTSTANRRRQLALKSKTIVSSCFSEPLPDSTSLKKRCAWVTTNTDPHYAAFHDEEWGVPVHDDKRLFELLVFSGALSELTWPAILSKRHIFREVFADFDPITVAKFNEKRVISPGSTASSLISDLKLRAIIENARQISKVVDEFGSFDRYIWSFVNYKPIVSRFRYPRQIPVKSPKADVISKDLVRRGFRSVGPTVIYSFMQVAGITNDHLISCFRFQECVTAVEGKEGDVISDGPDENKNDETMESETCMAIDELTLSSE
ncbi:DNA-3-methyladenine glycosylase I [Bertholletia excelsa]